MLNLIVLLLFFPLVKHFVTVVKCALHSQCAYCYYHSGRYELNSAKRYLLISLLFIHYVIFSYFDDCGEKCCQTRPSKTSRGCSIGWDLVSATGLIFYYIHIIFKRYSNTYPLIYLFKTTINTKLYFYYLSLFIIFDIRHPRKWRLLESSFQHHHLVTSCSSVTPHYSEETLSWIPQLKDVCCG